MSTCNILIYQRSTNGASSDAGGRNNENIGADVSAVFSPITCVRGYARRLVRVVPLWGIALHSFHLFAPC